MRYFYLIILIGCFSCNNERVLQLPEIEHAEVTEVLDVSPAYIFYDETQPDSAFLNRKNLISTTNWLVNVDKRLILKQAMPHIIFLQDKRRNAELHKNEEAQNYYTCNDTAIRNLGFIEFTNVNYEIISIKKDAISKHNRRRNLLDNILISENTIAPSYIIIDTQNKANAESQFKKILASRRGSIPLDKNIKITRLSLDIYFDSNLSFQDYVSIKSKLLAFGSEKIIFETNEFIY